jgi:hypothetical protein
MAVKHKVAELEGALLDAAVAKAEGIEVRVEFNMTNPPKAVACWPVLDGAVALQAGPLRFSTDWAHGGPIIERERMPHIPCYPGAGWYVTPGGMAAGGPPYWGKTLLIAAMRAYVASRFGEEVELP